MLQRLLWQGFSLDAAGIDHGALRCAAEHAFIDGERLTLIDFSHSSTNRRPNNVTCLVAGLIWGPAWRKTFAGFCLCLSVTPCCHGCKITKDNQNDATSRRYYTPSV